MHTNMKTQALHYLPQLADAMDSLQYQALRRQHYERYRPSRPLAGDVEEGRDEQRAVVSKDTEVLPLPTPFGPLAS